MAKLPLTNFSKGEFAPALYGRVDVPQYSAGLRQARNFILQRYGGAAFRPGFRFVGEVDVLLHTQRLMPFQFSNSQAYVLLSSEYQTRVIAKGGFVVEEDLKILSITKEAQAVLEVPYHNMAVGDRLYLDGIVGMTALNGRFVKVVSVDPTHIRIDVNTSAMPDFVSSTGITRSAPPPAPVEPPPAPLPAPTPPAEPPPTIPSGGSGTSVGGGAGGYDGDLQYVEED